MEGIKRRLYLTTEMYRRVRFKHYLQCLWYGIVRDYEANSYHQFKPTFFTSHKRPQSSKTRIHYPMCCASLYFIIHLSFHFDVESFRMVSISGEHTINSGSIVSSEVQSTLFI